MSRWSEAELSFFESKGILARDAAAKTITCDGCENRCFEDVEYSQDLDGTLTGWVICRERDDIGRVKIASEQLRTWVVVPSAFAYWLANELDASSTPEESVPNRLWWLGRINVNGCIVDSFFAHGVRWPDARIVFSKSAILRECVAPLIFTPDASTRLSIFGDLAVVSSLSRIVCFENGKLQLDKSAISYGNSIPTNQIDEVFQHSPDYRSVCLHGRQYSLTTSQARVVECLWEARQNQTPDISQDYLLESVLDTTQTRLKDVFKGAENWSSLITQGKTRGTFRLNI